MFLRCKIQKVKLSKLRLIDNKQHSEQKYTLINYVMAIDNNDQAYDDDNDCSNNFKSFVKLIPNTIKP